MPHLHLAGYMEPIEPQRHQHDQAVRHDHHPTAVQRSTNAPAKGPMITWGSIATSVAVASTVAEPVDWVSHHTRANCTRPLPSNENACPPQIVKKRGPSGWLEMIVSW